VTPGLPTRVPAILGAMQTLISDRLEELGETDVQVLYGEEPVSPQPEGIMLVPADADTPGAMVTYGAAAALGNANTEQTEFALLLRSFNGDGDMRLAVNRCGELFGIVQDIVNKNPVRSDCWDRLEMGPNASWHPFFTDRGANCYVALSLVASALV